MKKALTISVYGKYSAEDMQELYNRFTLRPTTAAIVKEGEMSRGVSPSHSRGSLSVKKGDGGKTGPSVYEATRQRVLGQQVSDPEMMIMDDEEQKYDPEDVRSSRESFHYNLGKEDKDQEEAKRLYAKLQEVKRKNAKLEEERSRLLAKGRSSCCSMF